MGRLRITSVAGLRPPQGRAAFGGRHRRALDRPASPAAKGPGDGGVPRRGPCGDPEWLGQAGWGEEQSEVEREREKAPAVPSAVEQRPAAHRLLRFRPASSPSRAEGARESGFPPRPAPADTKAALT